LICDAEEETQEEDEEESGWETEEDSISVVAGSFGGKVDGQDDVHISAAVPSALPVSLPHREAPRAPLATASSTDVAERAERGTFERPPGAHGGAGVRSARNQPSSAWGEREGGEAGGWPLRAPLAGDAACVAPPVVPFPTAPFLPKDAVSDLSLPTMTGLSRGGPVDLSLEAISRIYPSSGIPLSPFARGADFDADEGRSYEYGRFTGRRPAALNGFNGYPHASPAMHEGSFGYDSDEADSVAEIMQKYRQ
jgi:hypothetical protein